MSQKRKPRFLAFRSSTTFIQAAIAIAIFSIVPVFPFALEERANIPHDQVQKWMAVLLAVYGAGLLAASPIAGWIADNTRTRRLPLLWGLLALTGATVMLCLGRNIAVLVIGRLLQGIAAAVVWSVGLALLVDTVGNDKVGQSMGIVSLAMSLGILLAPLLGGIVYDRGGYYSVFAMGFGMLALDIVLRLVMIEKKVAGHYLDNAVNGDNVHQSPAIHEIVSNPGGVDEEIGPDRPNTFAVLTPSASALRPSMLGGYIQRLPPVLQLLKYPRLLVALIATLVQATLTTSLDTTLPLYTRETFHFGSTGAGLIFLAIVIPTMSSPFVGSMSDKYGPKWIAAAGFILACPFLVLLRLSTEDSIKDIVIFCVFLAFLGFSLTLQMTPTMAEITYVLVEMENTKPGRFGKNGAFAQGYGLFNVAFSGGTLVGPLWSGFLKDAAGWGTMAWSLGLLSFITSVPVLFYTGGKLRKQR
ncbi:major facilitator superfamily domain-containing protein [Kalaharituber pfeilii]|nr:major facilitator superfamily domain-containing protein [Kalaharituber pfeilii]